MKKLECPFGGDNTNCQSCVYYPDFEWSSEQEDCVRKEEKNESVK